ncbi:MAG: hypothetical protein N2688_00060 [Burkholderiaceae bacterium]|nr:hypothetical protein [Burkholderiaceae bacterium]
MDHELLHARLSRAAWLTRARAAKRDGGMWGQRTLAECIEGARIWHRRALLLLHGRSAGARP